MPVRRRDIPTPNKPASPKATETSGEAEVSQPSVPPASASPAKSTSRYEMLVAIGKTRRGEQFEAEESDPRVTSGWARLIEPPKPPDNVAAAFPDD